MNHHPTPDKPAARTAAMEFNTAWGATQPAALDGSPTPPPFREAIQGLVTREVDEPELFRQFFG